MAVNAALTATELTRLDLRDHLVDLRLTYVPRTVVGTATISTIDSFPASIISVSSPSAGWTSGRADQTVEIKSAGGVLRGLYRMRTAPSSGQFFLNQIGIADAGLTTIQARGTGYPQVGDTVSILERFDIWNKKPRQSDSFYQDYNEVVGSNHSAPNHVLRIKINNEYGHYATDVGASTSKAMTLVAESSVWATGSGSPTYAWTIPATWTGVSGTTSATCTGTAPVGSHWIYCTITYPTGGSTTTARFIRIHNNGDPPIKVLNQGIQDERDRSGRTMRVRVKQAEASVIPPGALCILWSDASWGGLAVDSATNKFCGYLDSRNFHAEPGYYESELEIVGPMGILNEVQSIAHQFTYDGSSADWSKLPASISTYQFVMWWILRWRSTFLTAWDFTPLSVSSSIHRDRNITIDPGTVGGQLKVLADAIDANVGCRSNGEMIVKYDPSLLTDRSGVVTRATLTAARWRTEDFTWKEIAPCGMATLEGHSSDLTADTRWVASAPGLDSPGRGGRTATLSKKLFEDQGNAQERVGDYAAKENNPYPEINVHIPKNWDVFEPVDMQRVIVQVPANKSPTGVQLDITAIPKSVSKEWIPGKRAKINLALEAETDGTVGQARRMVDENTQVIPNPADLSGADYTIPELPIDVPPEVVTEPGSNPIRPGKYVHRATTTKVLRAFDGMISAPTWDDITPAGVTAVKLVTFDLSERFSRAAWSLTNDGTTTTIWYTEDEGATTPTWTAMGTILGVWTHLNTFLGLPGTILMYCPNPSGATTGSVTVTFDAGGYGSYALVQTAPGVSTIVASGNPGNAVETGPNSTESISMIDVTMPQVCTITQVDFEYQRLAGAGSLVGLLLYFYDATGALITSTSATPSVGNSTTWRTKSFTGLSVANCKTVRVGAGNSLTAGAMNRLDNVKVTYTITPSSEAFVAYSNDYGGTQTVVSAGGSPGSEGGFDATRLGPVSLAGADAAVVRASAFAGAYAAASGGSLVGGDPGCIVVPRYLLGSVSASNGGALPDFIVAAAATIGGEALWKVRGLTGDKTAITPSVSGNKATAAGDHCVSTWKGKHIVYAGIAGGNRYLLRSLDTGTVWDYDAATGVVSVLCQRLSVDGKRWIAACGASGLLGSTDYGATWFAITASGTNVYAEIFG